MCQKKLIWIICNKRTKEILFQPPGRPNVANLLPETRYGLPAVQGAWHLNSALFPPGAPRGGDQAGEGLGGGFLQPVGEGFIFVEPVACCFYPVTALARQNSGRERWLVADDGREDGDTCSRMSGHDRCCSSLWVQGKASLRHQQGGLLMVNIELRWSCRIKCRCV